MYNLLKEHGLEDLGVALRPRALPSIAFSLEDVSVSRSRVGGEVLLAPGFEWPSYLARPVYPPGQPARERKLDALLQIDLREVAVLGGPSGLLPTEGLLTFFYDLEHQPWGYDPNNLGGSRVVLVPDVGVSRVATSDPEYALPPAGMRFCLGETLPHFGSRAWESLERDVDLPDGYFEFLSDFERSFYPDNSGLHRLFGHSANSGRHAARGAVGL